MLMCRAAFSTYNRYLRPGALSPRFKAGTGPAASVARTTIGLAAWPKTSVTETLTVGSRTLAGRRTLRTMGMRSSRIATGCPAHSGLSNTSKRYPSCGADAGGIVHDTMTWSPVHRAVTFFTISESSVGRSGCFTFT